jgi:hypothetical protein
MPKQITLIPLKDKIAILDKSYQAFESFIKKRLFGFIIYDEKKAKKLKAEIFEKIARQDKINRVWALRYIPQAYNHSASISKAKLENMGIKQQKKNFEQISRESKSKSIIKIIRYMDNTNAQIMDRVNTYFRLLKKSYKTLGIQNLADWWSDEIEEGVTEIKKWSLIPTTRTTLAGYEYQAVPTSREIQKRTKKLFEKVFGDFDFIQVPLKTGGVRNYKPDKYLHMVARTEGRMTQTQAVLDRIKEYDNDLVQVSTHNNPCRICVPFEGQIYSTSGKSKIYPPLDDAPPFHPNCEHVIFPTSIPTIKANLKDPRVPKPPAPAWGLTVKKQLEILKKARKAA